MNKLKRLKNRFHSFCDAVKSVADGKWDSIAVALDIVYCKLRFKSTLDEYQKYDFHKYKDRYRKYFFLNRHRRLLAHVNVAYFTKSKYIFYKRIPEMYKREIILAPQCGEKAFVEFVKRQKEIIMKPDDGSYGIGITRFVFTDEDAAKEQFASFSAQSPVICEEVIRQHSQLQKLNPNSVNSLRIISVLRNGEVEIISASLKSGTTQDSIVDNMVSGGVAAQVDLASGIVYTHGVDYSFNTYTHHPLTGVQIIGFNIPHWEKVLDYVKQAHLGVSQCMLFGWDVAITQDGVDIIEANLLPGWRITQVTDKLPKGKKVLPYIKKDILKQGKWKYEPDYSPFEYKEQ